MTCSQTQLVCHNHVQLPDILRIIALSVTQEPYGEMLNVPVAKLPP